MVMAKVTNQREKDKFVEDANEKTAVRTLPTGGATSASQTLILTELGQKTEPADTQKTQEVVATGINGAPVTVGTTIVEMTFTGTTRVISLKSASTNTGLIWFGPSNVTNAGANAWGELTADSSVEIEVNDASAVIYCISDTAAQVVYKVALT